MEMQRTHSFYFWTKLSTTNLHLTSGHLLVTREAISCTCMPHFPSLNHITAHQAPLLLTFPSRLHIHKYLHPLRLAAHRFRDGVTLISQLQTTGFHIGAHTVLDAAFRLHSYAITAALIIIVLRPLHVPTVISYWFWRWIEKRHSPQGSLSDILRA